MIAQFPFRSVQRDMTGEEAFAARCAMAPLSVSKVPQSANRLQARIQGKRQHDQENVPSTHLRSMQEGLEEGEIADDILHRTPAPEPQASSTPYFTPRWQPSPLDKLPNFKAPSKLYSAPGRKQKPLVGRKKASTNGEQSTPGRQLLGSTPDFGQGRQLRSATRNRIKEPAGITIPDVRELDRLDPGIRIQPRGKASHEVLFVLRPEFHGTGVLPPFPPAMLVIIHQYMVANGFISPRGHMSKREKKLHGQSLLMRLDLHETPDVLTNQKQYLGSAAQRLHEYINKQSKEWMTAGIFLKKSRKKAAPAFHECTQAWLRPEWDGVISLPTHGSAIQSSLSTTNVSRLCDITKFIERERSINPPESQQNTHEPTGAVNLTKEKIDGQPESTSRKRRATDHTDAPVPKHVKEHEHHNGQTQKPLREEDNHFKGPHDNAFPLILECIRNAHHTLEDLAPKSVKELAALQQDWQDHGYPSTLAEGLFVAQSYTFSMKRYLDNALDLLSLLEDCAGWNVKGKEFAVDLDPEHSGPKSDLIRSGGT